MLLKRWFSLSSILDESPFFTELSIKEREDLIKELLQTYPQLDKQIPSDIDLGYEASWLIKQTY
ncbi:MAG: hypothetical protein HZC49_02715 [Nitrospirae bacterium]|nr:hypothetical protein [Nitrospirota bacterium]